MRTEQRFAGIAATASFLWVGLSGYFATANPLHALLYGLAAALTLGYLAFKMAYIWSHPTGHLHRRGKTVPVSDEDDPTPRTPLTGEETFLDDVGS